MNNHAYAVILAGGSGERFWPLSTKARPKQFVDIFGGKPLIRHAVDRLAGFVPPERVFIVTSRDLAEASAEACPMVPRANIVGEPCRRDTAAASALACGLVAAHDPDGIAIILTADQIVADEAGFRQVLSDAVDIAAADECIVTVGIKPSRPATGFGYIEAADSLDADCATEFHKARRFVEKPDVETAERYMASGRFLWNSGMFIWSVRTMSAAVRRLTPGLSVLLSLPSETLGETELSASLDAVYPGLERISVDYAIMEKFGNIVVACGDFGWDDVGTWPSVADHLATDASGNVIVGNAELLDCRDDIVISDGSRLVAVLGLEDVTVVQTANATLVCPKSRAQDLKKLVKQIGERADGAKYV